MLTIGSDEPLAVGVVKAIQGGGLIGLNTLLEARPGLATARIVSLATGRYTGPVSRTLLHVATDWPGHFPNGAATVAALITAGANVNGRVTGPHTETPLHWAASSNDVPVLDALLDAGADINAPGAVIGGGSPLANATAFGQWDAARRLIERGARANLWEAAALGLMPAVVQSCTGEASPGPEHITSAFWGACHGGQRRAAEYLLDRGADLNWIGFDNLTPLDAARRSGADELVTWLRSLGANSALELG